jgi:hypothetical protein
MTPAKRSPWKLYLYFALTVVFVLCALIADRITVLNYNLSHGGYSMQTNLQWMFWLFLILAGFCSLPLFDAVLRSFDSRKMLPQSLGHFYRRLEENGGFFAATGVRKESLGGRLLIAGFAIFGTVFILSKSNAVREMDVNGYVYEYLGGRIIGHPHWPANPQPITASLRLSWHGLDDSVKLHDVLTIVQDLKRAGAKAVMVDMRGTGGFIKNYETLRAIDETGISVLGLSDRYGRFVDFGQLNTKDPRGEFRASRGGMTMKSWELGEDPFLMRFKPEVDRFNGVQFLDIALELLRKYHNYPREMEATRSGDNIIFGDYRIPLGRDGWTYTRQSVLTWFDPTLSVTKNGPNDTLKYKGYLPSTHTWSYANSQDLKEKFNGKIVFLERSDLAGQDDGWMLINSYRSALQMMSEGGLVARAHTLHVWITLLCLVLAGLIAFKLRALPSVVSIFGMGCIVLIGCWLLYYRFNLLIDIFYPLLAVGMSMFIFPSVTVTQKSDEAEK